MNIQNKLFQRNIILKIVAAAASVWLVFDCFFIISPTEMGNIRRLGVVVYAQPLGPGSHFKIPFVDKVDRLQITLDTLHIPPFDVTTVDNQKVTLEINFNYTTPKEQVNHILYGIGHAGNVDIDDQVLAVAKDRAGRIFAGQNMVNVNANRTDIQNAMEQSISTSVHDLFGIQPHSLQIVGITPSSAFMASNELAVKAKNDAVAADNTKRTKQFEADQKVITAKGEADSAIEAATGRASSVKIEAEADKAKLILEGEGEEANLKAQISAFGNAELYIKYVQAEAQLKWNGTPPQIMSGNGGSVPNIIVPMASLTTK